MLCEWAPCHHDFGQLRAGRSELSPYKCGGYVRIF